MSITTRDILYLFVFKIQSGLNFPLIFIIYHFIDFSVIKQNKKIINFIIIYHYNIFIIEIFNNSPFVVNLLLQIIMSTCELRQNCFAYLIHIRITITISEIITFFLIVEHLQYFFGNQIIKLFILKMLKIFPFIIISSQHFYFF